jgi:hypothetical protein
MKKTNAQYYTLLTFVVSGIFIAPQALAKDNDSSAGIKGGSETSKQHGQDRKGNKEHYLFLRSARENADRSKVTLPLYRGTSGGQEVAFIITDSSSLHWARSLGVNFAPKLANTAGGHGSQLVSVGKHGVIDFPATVDFSPVRCIDIGDYGQCAAVPFLPFGPACFAAGAVGNAGYSPLIELPDGTVLNASHVRNSSGHADKATINEDGTVSFDETTGLALGKVVHYFSVDASVAPGAVLENVTFAPELQKATPDPLGPGNENASSGSARAGIIAFTNGQTGLDNPNRQGLNSTIVDGPVDGCTPLSPPVPLNILQFIPAIPNQQTDGSLYSPLWDVHFATWQLPLDQRLVQNDFEQVRNNPNITNPAGAPFAPAGPVVANCPIVSIDLD